MSTDKQGSYKKKTDMGINSYDLNINKKEFRNEWGGFSPLASTDCVLVYERPFYVTKKLCIGKKVLILFPSSDIVQSYLWCNKDKFSAELR